MEDEIEFNPKADYRNFTITDPFNPENKIKGRLCICMDYRYGMMEIFEVNGVECPQTIYCTPKIHYPFDKNHTFRNIPYENVEIYEKVDGTNIFGFVYHDANGAEFITYKTRLSPVLSSSRWGNFLEMWKEMLVKYPQIPKVIEENGINVSFELYGKRNKILIEYDTKLDMVILFGVDNDANVKVPSQMETFDVPVTPLIKTVEYPIIFHEAYEEVRQWLNTQIKVEDVELQNDLVTGMEGSIWYVINEGKVSQYKCKPDYVLDIHWKAGGIPKHCIHTTIMNAYELVNSLNITPDYAMVKKLLMEEFAEGDIDKREEKIKHMMYEIKDRKQLEAEVCEIYEDEMFDIVKNKRDCMRHFGQMYGKKASTKIFTILWRNYGSE